MRRTAGVVTAVAAMVLLAGCAATAPTTTAQPSVSASPSEAQPTTLPTETPSAVGPIIISTAGISSQTGDTSLDSTFADGEKVVDLLAKVTGTEPQTEVVDNSDSSYPSSTRYDFDGIAVLITDGSNGASIVVDAASVNGIPITTAAGIGVGSSREDVVAAGALEGLDSDGDGAPDEYEADPVEVPDTSSLVHQGEVGTQFVLIRLTGDAVTQLQAPGNDYGDV